MRGARRNTPSFSLRGAFLGIFFSFVANLAYGVSAAAGSLASPFRYPLDETMDEVGISYVNANSSYECHGGSFDAPLQPPWFGASSAVGRFADFGASRDLGTLSSPRFLSLAPLSTLTGEAFAHLPLDSSLAHGRMCPYRGPPLRATLRTLEPPRVK